MLSCNPCVEEVVYDVLEMGFKDLYCKCYCIAIPVVNRIASYYAYSYISTY